MASIRLLLVLAAGFGVVVSQCPFGHTSEVRARSEHEKNFEKRAVPVGTEQFLSQFTINETDTYLTTDVGGPIEDQDSLRAGDRGPTLLEDFIFRQKITHFDHERVRDIWKLISQTGD